MNDRWPGAAGRPAAPGDAASGARGRGGKAARGPAAPPGEAEALQLALRWLGVRARTERELRDRLAGRGAEPAVIEAVLERLRRWGYLDDRRLAVDMVDRAGVRQIGPRRVRAELLRRGVAADVVGEALAERLPPERERELALQLARRRWERLAAGEPGDPARLAARLYRFLVGRGFRPEVAEEAARRAMEEGG